MLVGWRIEGIVRQGMRVVLMENEMYTHWVGNIVVFDSMRGCRDCPNLN